MDQYKASKELVLQFLADMKAILSAKNFDINNQFLLVNRPENNETLQALRYQKEDVVELLKQLEVSNYYQSVPDCKDASKPDFHIFFIQKHGKDIYIKIRIQKKNQVFCISFHFANYSHFKMIYE